MSTRRITANDLLSLKWINGVALSPDGRTVAYSQEVVAQRSGADEGPSHEYHAHLHLIETSGGPSRQFTFGEHRDRRPVWSPDGTRLLFVSDRGPAPKAGASRPKHLWVIPLAGGEAVRITQDDHAPSEPSWSPDGEQIAFTGKPPVGEKPASDVRVIVRMKHKADGEGFWDNRYKHIFVVPSGGGPARQITEGDFDHREPSWSPDGTHLAFHEAALGATVSVPTCAALRRSG